MNLRYDMIVCYAIRPDASGKPGELLQLRRAKGDHLEGIYTPIRGGIEPGETAWRAALRELREETGLVPNEFYQLDTVDLFYLAASDTLWQCPGFCAIVPRDATVTLNHEHDDYRWIDRARFDRDSLWPGERNQLAELCREILDDGPAKAHLRLKPPFQSP